MRYVVTIFMFSVITLCQAQTQDSVQRRNTIKYNLLSNWVFPNSGALSYERVTKANESWSVMVGLLTFPKLGSFNSGARVTDEKHRSGFVVGGEYRFYLKKENKHLAPHGVFIGPYTNLFYFKNERTITSADGMSQAILNSKLSAFNIGFQVGYQFVIRNRWTIDLVFLGPSVARYGLSLDLSGDYDADELLANEIVAALADRFPLVKDLISDQSVDLNGTKNIWSGGFRYQLNVGYHFGRTKKR